VLRYRYSDPHALKLPHHDRKSRDLLWGGGGTEICSDPPNTVSYRYINPCRQRSVEELSLNGAVAEQMHYNTKLGFILFLIYLFFYSGFVFLNTFSPKTMERTPIEGINFAIWFGFALILTAFLLALIYGFRCRPEGEETGLEKRDGEEQRS